MRSVRAIIAASTIGLLSSGCAGIYGAPVTPPPGLLYAKFQAPIDIDAQATERGSKVGRSFSQSILGLVATGDASISSAAAAGGITTIRHVDYEFENILGVYSKFTIVVYGD